jgi:hypothetical protein
MKIMIIGSMAFARKMLEVKNKLEELGYQAEVPPDIEDHLNNLKLVDNLEENVSHCIKKNIIKKSFNMVANSDAVLVINEDRNNIKGYIGTSALMETGLAYYLNKKIFILNPLPSWEKQRWVHELTIMQVVILDGDFSKIK